MITPNNYYSQLEGFYRIGKTITVGDTAPENTTLVDLRSTEYKNKGILIDPLSGNVSVQLKFYDPTTSDGMSSDWVTIDIQVNPINFLSCVIPVRIAQIRVTNPPAGGGYYNIQVSLLN